MNKPKKRLGELLLDAGLVDEYQLRSALSHQQQWGGRLGKNLVELGLVSEVKLVAFLAKHFRLPAIDFRKIRVSPHVLKIVSPEMARKHHIMPLFQGEEDKKKFLAVAMSNPTDLLAIDELEFASGSKVRPVVASDIMIGRAIEFYYDHQGGELSDHSARPSSEFKYSDLIAMTRLFLKEAKEQASDLKDVADDQQRPEFEGAERTVDFDAEQDAGDDSIVVFGSSGEKTIALDENGPSTKTAAPSPAPQSKAASAGPDTDKVLRALINVLIDKGVINKDDIRNKLKS